MINQKQVEKLINVCRAFALKKHLESDNDKFLYLGIIDDWCNCLRKWFNNEVKLNWENDDNLRKACRHFGINFSYESIRSFLEKND